MKYLSLQKNDKVGTITINHSPANALSSEVLKELSEILDKVEHENEIRVLILKGEGRFFSAGADIKEFTKVNSSDEFTNLARNGQQIFERIERFSKPIIAVIHGAALGGGLELAMSCHIRYVSEEAKLGLPELQLGLIPGFAGTQRLPRYIGTGKALEMLLSSEPISGIEAVEYGLANQAFPEDRLFEEAEKRAEKFGAKSPLSIKYVLDLMKLSTNSNFDDAVETEAIYFGKVFESNDGKEGIRAFIEKRQPEFKGN